MERNKSIDILKSIGILSVLIGHLLWLPPFVRVFIFSYHMPLFFIASGFFYKKTTKNNLTGGGKILLYYLLSSVIYVVLCGIAGEYSYQQQIEAVIFANANPMSSHFLGDKAIIRILWFLPALFWCKRIFSLVNNKIDFGRYQIIIYLGISYFAYQLAGYINIPFGLLTGISAIIFYVSGIELKNSKISQATFYVLILFWILSLFVSKLDIGAFIYQRYVICIIGGIGGTLVFLKLSERISKYGFSDLLAYIGRNSLYIYLAHALLTKVIVLTTGYYGIYRNDINLMICVLVPILLFSYHKIVIINKEK